MAARANQRAEGGRVEQLALPAGVAVCARPSARRRLQPVWTAARLASVVAASAEEAFWVRPYKQGQRSNVKGQRSGQRSRCRFKVQVQGAGPRCRSQV